VRSGACDARIAVNHARILHQKCASKKANLINAARMMQISNKTRQVTAAKRALLAEILFEQTNSPRRLFSAE
jgi:hypothetical protein